MLHVQPLVPSLVEGEAYDASVQRASSLHRGVNHFQQRQRGSRVDHSTGKALFPSVCLPVCLYISISLFLCPPGLTENKLLFGKRNLPSVVKRNRAPRTDRTSPRIQRSIRNMLFCIALNTTPSQNAFTTKAVSGRS